MTDRQREAEEAAAEARERYRLPTTCGYHEIVVGCEDDPANPEPKCFGCPNRTTKCDFLKREDW